MELNFLAVKVTTSGKDAMHFVKYVVCIVVYVRHGSRDRVQVLSYYTLYMALAVYLSFCQAFMKQTTLPCIALSYILRYWVYCNIHFRSIYKFFFNLLSYFPFIVRTAAKFITRFRASTARITQRTSRFELSSHSLLINSFVKLAHCCSLV